MKTFHNLLKKDLSDVFYNIYTIFVWNFEDTESTYIIKIQNNKDDEIGDELTRGRVNQGTSWLKIAGALYL